MSFSLLTHSPFTPSPTLLFAVERPNSPVPSANDGMADTKNRAAARNTLCTIRLRTLTSYRPGLTWPGKLCDQRIRRRPHPVQTLLTTWTNSSHEPASRFQQASYGCTFLLRDVSAGHLPVTVEL